MNHQSIMKAIILFSFLLFSSGIFAQENWPHVYKAKSGAEVSVYQPQLEELKGDKLTGRAAISVKEQPGTEPVFGAIFFTATMNTNRDTRLATLESITIDNVKLAGIDDTAKIRKLKSFLETEIPAQKVQTTLDEILTSIENTKGQSSTDLKNDPPKIIYVNKQTTLVTTDGEPKLQDDDKLKMKRVINSAFLIIQYPKDNQYYLYGGNFWYKSSSITSGYAPVTPLPKELKEIDKQIKEQAKKEGAKNSSDEENKTPPQVVVATEPTELIQTDGEPNYQTIEGTNLLYVSNSEDDIFKDINTNKQYILVSGRWYTSSSLNGPWQYVEADKMPADFAKIPVGSDKDNVLASIPGTEQAEQAVMDAQIPQTAKVDRSTSTVTVKYDGDPKFEKIEGTSLELAMNTSSTVIRSGNTYYCVDNGIWYKASSATGPWKVSDDRPQDVDKIPASSSAYNTQFVYIYDATPQYVYVGYVPGYMGCYVYNGVVVYGTGYYYNPWYGPYYYPRPVSYGFSFHYNPWTGWSMGFHYSAGWFNFSVYGGHGGYWGCPGYRPPYHPPYHGGYYGPRGPTYVHNGDININVDRSNNVYRGQNGVSTNDVKRGNQAKQQPAGGANAGNKAGAGAGASAKQQPAGGANAANKAGGGASAKQQPAGGAGQVSNNKNNVATDKQGNVYRQNDQGNWDQRTNSGWQQNNNANTQQQLNRDQQQRQQAQQRNNGYNQMNHGGNMGGGSRPAGGGGARPGGGGGGRR